jgi:magnesium-transporting ATPase (P-type)
MLVLPPPNMFVFVMTSLFHYILFMRNQEPKFNKDILLLQAANTYQFLSAVLLSPLMRTMGVTWQGEIFIISKGKNLSFLLTPN